MASAENTPGQMGGVINVAGKNNEDIYYYSILPVEYIMEKGLISESIVGQFLDNPTAQGGKLIVDSFRANPKFVSLLHEFLSVEGAKSKSLLEEAARQKDGWVYIIDKRVKDLNGKIPPEDIIGGFKIESGKPVEYTKNPKHVLLTNDGVFQLDSELQKSLVKFIKSKYQ